MLILSKIVLSLHNSVHMNILISMSRFEDTLKVKCNGHNFFQIYTFSDSDFSTLIENRNNFQFSQAVCAKYRGLINRGDHMGSFDCIYFFQFQGSWT
jgi:hypothetical protein